MRAALALVLAPIALALLALASAAAAQGEEPVSGCAPPTLVAPPGLPGALEPGASVTIPLSIENPNGAPVTRAVAFLNVTGPSGWSFHLETNPVSLGPRNESLDHLTVTAPSRGGGAERGNITLSASFSCYVGGVASVQRSAAVTLALDARLTPAPAPWSALILLALVLVGAVTAAVWTRSHRSRVLLVAEAAVVNVSHDKGGRIAVTVENRRRDPDAVALTAEASPRGWSAFVAVPEASLEGKEELALWVSVRPPPGARVGAKGRVVVRAASREHPQESATIALEAVVVAAGAEGATAR